MSTSSAPEDRSQVLLARLGGTEVLVDPGDTASIGRARASDLRSNHERVSRHHALLHHDGGRWWFVDTDSLNGSYVDGAAVGRVPIERPTSIRLADERTGPVLEVQLIAYVGSFRTIGRVDPSDGSER